MDMASSREEENELGDAVLEVLANSLCASHGTQISELGIFFSSNDTGNISTAVQQSSNALGVASWALSPLFLSAKRRLSTNRSDVRAASALLVATPDHNTAWAIRKAALVANGSIEAELLFSSLILRRDPKAPAAWAHRSWVLNRAGWHKGPPEAELRLAEGAANLRPCNYYAGVHRMLALEALAAKDLPLEVVKSRTWIETHVSDCSGWWFHHHVVRKSIKNESLRDSLLGEEKTWAEEMHVIYGTQYESVRRYLRWLQKASDEAM